MTAHKPFVLRSLMLMLFMACAFLLPAQNIDIQSQDDKPIDERLVYNHQNTIKLAIHSRGLGAGFKIGRIKSIHLVRNWQAEVVSLHSLKEIKTINISQYNTRPFVYGKLNYVYVLRFGYGEDRRIFGKPYWGGIETWWTYEVGGSLALLKPYYYYVIAYYPDNNSGYYEKIEEHTFERGVDVLGRSSFAKGISETKVTPGVHASLGLSFEIGKSRLRAQSIDVEVKGEYFPLGVSIMDSERDKKFFLTFMLSYSWGSRFNKY